MDTEFLQKCIKKIKVQNIENADVEVINKSPLKMMGKGRQGAVFQFTDDICVKVFGNEEDCEREHYALSLGKDSDLFPKVHAKGPLYIAMDIVKGVDVREYLQSQPLTKELSSKLIEMLITFKEIGFERIDHHKRQIYVQPDGNLKVIDVARTVWRDRVYPYPRKLLTSLGEEYKTLFLTHVAEMAPELHEEWKHYIQMEEISREIYQSILSQYKGKELKKQSQKLLTKNNDSSYASSLEGLVHKVFKEEWVKTMLAIGHNPDDIMDKIDEYWDRRELEFENEMKPNRGYEPRRQVDIGKMTGRTWSMDKGKQGEKGRYDEKNYREDKDKKEKNEHQGNKWNKITFDERGRRKRRFK
ncbi:hypothetical protein P9E76_20650 [Schinkia azotoformans]|uniref:Uncharacterized protein n=1 Tax=Schinkia azotoformans LMG 9581 TaxID=1131731 RepID=K6DRZ6_SCHAZ|nr:hypothetical protein [Schinkia azotoformans]EKN71129.1 hypothetical protein BAZO_00565 [Schinkia azotoformans LMG 9581]MEC1640344.1 hypothetical protein [Schinkia azotoformans]MEC1947406.1 hypothetical protein [Schinkia azotoformans]